MENKTIKKWFVLKQAEEISQKIKTMKNGESMYEHEIFEFIGMLEDEMLKLNGYEVDNEIYSNAIGISKIQREMLKGKCPKCEVGELHIVAEEDEDQETCLWCDYCDCSVDTSGGYVA